MGSHYFLNSTIVLASWDWVSLTVIKAFDALSFCLASGISPPELMVFKNVI
jgi:hypothetical protein